MCYAERQKAIIVCLPTNNVLLSFSYILPLAFCLLFCGVIRIHFDMNFNVLILDWISCNY